MPKEIQVDIDLKIQKFPSNELKVLMITSLKMLCEVKHSNIF